MKKAGIISQARMTSSRLPGKVLMEIGGKTLTAHHVDRLAESGFPVFLATTINTEDDPLAAYAEANKLPVFRGSEHNVLSRFFLLAEQEGLDVIARTTCDCPLIDGRLVGDYIRYYLEQNDPNLYLSNGFNGYPNGLNFEVFSFKLLKEAYENADGKDDQEHVTSYIWKNKSGHVKLELPSYLPNRKNFRVTVDTPQDFELAQKLINDYRADQMNYLEIIRLLEDHPELLAINQSVKQVAV